jgi:cell division protein FtsZ
MAIMGIGIASGDNRATMAAERAISHPLLEDLSISGARGVLMNITSTSDLTMEEMTEASDRIYNEVGDDADIIWGAVVEDSLGDEMRVTVIATGIGAESELPQNHIDFAHKGKVRDITPSDLQNAQNLDVPTFIRRQEAVGESGGATYRGHKGLIIDSNDLDVPTFLRRKAD